MGRGTQRKSNAGVFFMATLVLWFVSVIFEILFNKRIELITVLGGVLFFQTANWVIRFWMSRDPLLVNTSVSLLHSIFTSASVVFILLNRQRTNGWMQIFEHNELLHSVFLHVRKVRRMAGIRNAESKTVKAEWVLNWFTFFIARLIPHLLITIKLIRDAKRFEAGLELPLALFGMLGMNLLNIGLGIDLVGAYKRERNPSQSHHNN
ncbi:hypothetical protein Ancab_037335 [Ancistrocladus abbreviatus]